MTSDPEEIRNRIEHTRSTLSQDVDALADQANPVHMAQRQVSRAKAAGSRLLDRVLGSAEDVREVAGETVRTAGQDLADKASDVGDAVTGMPQNLKRQAEGNPLAAGLVAFGFGLLLAAVFPASRKEQEWAETIKEQAQPLTDQVTTAGKELVDNLAEPAKQAVEAVKGTATEAVQHVQSEATDAAGEVRETATGAVSDVTEEARGAAAGVADETRGAASDVADQARRAADNQQ